MYEYIGSRTVASSAFDSGLCNHRLCAAYVFFQTSSHWYRLDRDSGLIIDKESLMERG